MLTPDLDSGGPSAALRSSAVLFGAELRRARARAGLTQAELGARAGMSKNGVYAIERGIRSPNLETILRLCEGLSLAPGALLNPVAEGWTREACAQKKSRARHAADDGEYRYCTYP